MADDKKTQGKKVKIYTPNPAFKGVREGVTFEDGVGLADEAAARVLIHDYGYSRNRPKSEEKDA